MRRTRTALVIGGGIAGSAVAIALQKAGIDPVVYEAHPASAEGVGAFLTIAPNGIEALKVLGTDAGALASAFPTPSITLRSSTGKRLGHTLTGGAPGAGPVSHTTKRADLYRALQDETIARDVRVEYGKRLVAADETNVGVRAMFADGTEALGDVLIGCDGVNSVVRSMIDPHAPTPVYAGLLNTGGYARGVDLDVEPGRYEMIFGRRAFFGFVVAPDGEVWWFANLPWRGESPRDAYDDSDALARVFADDAGPAVALIHASPEIMPTATIQTLPHLPRWHSRRMVVIGDACHAPSPSSGQGASLSIEDAVVLAKCMRDLPDPRAAFAEFESARRARVERIVKWAQRINNSKAAGPVARLVRDAMMPTILRVTADSKAARTTHNYRIGWTEPP